MKYKLNSSAGMKNIKHEILSRRGVEDVEKYLNTSGKDVLPPILFGDVMSKAYDVLKGVIADKGSIGILVDSDFDGMASASMLYSYLYNAYGQKSLYYLHEFKEHGLGDKVALETIKKDIVDKNLKLLFVPDAGSNDVVESKAIKDLGCQIIILDHHIVEKVNKHAIVINPQLVKNYPNLESSGCMVTWKFLNYVDSEDWNNFSERYVDLVACSIVSDSMKIKSSENRYIITWGLSTIKNKFLLESITNDFRIKETPPTITDIAFYLVPSLNGMIRSGKQEEKELVFRALCEIDESFDYVKRDKTEIKENIYQRAVRLCTNAKARQDNQIKKGIEIVIKDIEENKRNDNSILFALADDKLDRNFTGLVAMKLASKYHKPCVLLRETKEDYFAGSIRNFNDSPLTDLKAFLESMGYVAWIQGHANASGIGLTKKQLIKTIELSNEKLKDYDFSPVHFVDFEFYGNESDDLTEELLSELYSLRSYYGQGISEVKIVLNNVKINSSKISFFGSRETSEKKSSWKFELKNGVDILNFRSDEEDFVYKNFGENKSGWDGRDLQLNLVCKVGRTEFNGERRWCMVVEDYEQIGDK